MNIKNYNKLAALGQLQFGVIFGECSAPGGGISLGLRKISRNTLVSPALVVCYRFCVQYPKMRSKLYKAYHGAIGVLIYLHYHRNILRMYMFLCKESLLY